VSLTFTELWHFASSLFLLGFSRTFTGDETRYVMKSAFKKIKASVTVLRWCVFTNIREEKKQRSCERELTLHIEFEVALL
jgi:hypothetical protein